MRVLNLLDNSIAFLGRFAVLWPASRSFLLFGS